MVHRPHDDCGVSQRFRPILGKPTEFKEKMTIEVLEKDMKTGIKVCLCPMSERN
jgi:hypothetical protein